MIRRLTSHSHALIAVLILATAGPAWAQSAPRIYTVTVSNSHSVDMTVAFSENDPMDNVNRETYSVAAGQSRQLLLTCNEESACAMAHLEILGLHGTDCRARLRAWGQASDAPKVTVGITKSTSTNYGLTRFKCDFQGDVRTVYNDQGMIYTPNSVLGN